MNANRTFLLCCFATALIVSPSRTEADERVDPDVMIWKAIRHGLTQGDGTKFFEEYAKGALIPGGAEGVRALRGTITSITPADRPTAMTLAMYGSRVPEVTIKFAGQPVTKSFRTGSEATFQAIAIEFTKDPFMLTFELCDSGCFIEPAK
jgi:hypothetical protein